IELRHEGARANVRAAVDGKNDLPPTLAVGSGIQIHSGVRHVPGSFSGARASGLATSLEEREGLLGALQLGALAELVGGDLDVFALDEEDLPFASRRGRGAAAGVAATGRGGEFDLLDALAERLDRLVG